MLFLLLKEKNFFPFLFEIKKLYRVHMKHETPDVFREMKKNLLSFIESLIDVFKVFKETFNFTQNTKNLNVKVLFKESFKRFIVN